MTTQQERLEAIKADILTACEKVRKFQTGKRRNISLIREALKRELTNAGHAIQLNQSIMILFESRPTGQSETIDVIVDQLVGICIVRGNDVTEYQWHAHLRRIQDSGLPLGFVVTLDGSSLDWKQINVPTNR